MTSNSSANNGLNTGKTYNWSARQWLAFFSMLLFAWTVLYLVTHSRYGLQGYEYTRFNDADIRHINSILVSANTQETAFSDYAVKHRVSNTNDGFLDAYPSDSAQPISYASDYPETTYLNNQPEDIDRKERVKKAMVYVLSQYGNRIDQEQAENIQRYIYTFNTSETGIFLNDFHLKIKSFFWLSGALLYGEIVFWTIFGVLCSLLLFVGNTIRRNIDINRDVLYQAARLLYAPFAGMILVLCYSYVKGGSSIDIQPNEGIIVFAFILGFYSGTVMEWLDRLRAVIFNTGNYRDGAYDSNRTAETRQAAKEEELAQPVGKVPVQQPVLDDEPEVEYFENVPPAKEDTATATSTKKKSLLNENNELEEVEVDLKLDFSGLFDEEREHLQRLGFNKTIVTLHNVNGRDIIPAQKRDDHSTLFIANDVKPGIYIARATLSVRIKDDHIINLFGEKTAYITEEKPGLELYVKKYEATD